MTRKRFVKILLSLGVGKREAERLAVMQRKYCGQYYDIRQDWNTWWNMFHLEICRFCERVEEMGESWYRLRKTSQKCCRKRLLTRSWTL